MSDTTIILKMLKDRFFLEERNEDLIKRLAEAREYVVKCRALLEKAQKHFDDPDIETDGSHLERCQKELSIAQDNVIGAQAMLQGYEAGFRRGRELLDQIIKYG